MQAPYGGEGPEPGNCCNILSGSLLLGTKGDCSLEVAECSADVGSVYSDFGTSLSLTSSSSSC